MPASELRDIDFEKISRLVYEKCGINLHEGKKELVKSRLGKRLREGGFTSFSQYYKYVITEEGTDELVHMIDCISTNLTYFFREDKHFKKLDAILPELPGVLGSKGTPCLRIWSAGCSTGEEAYSLAVTVKESRNGCPGSTRILATDISTTVLKKAADGIYPANKLNSIPSALLKKYFQQGKGRWEGHCRIKDEIRGMVHFTRFNLMDPPPRDLFFDVIFCRNVMIYFDKETQATLVNRLWDRLLDGGYFFIGHSESLTGLKHSFKYIEPSVYRK